MTYNEQTSHKSHFPLPLTPPEVSTLQSHSPNRASLPQRSPAYTASFLLLSLHPCLLRPSWSFSLISGLSCSVVSDSVTP